MQIGFAPTPDTLALIALPHFELYGRWDHPAMNDIVVAAYWTVSVGMEIGNFESELEHLAVAALFLPGVGKLEDPIVDPNPVPDLLEYPDLLGALALALVSNRRIEETTI